MSVTINLVIHFSCDKLVLIHFYCKFKKKIGWKEIGHKNSFKSAPVYSVFTAGPRLVPFITLIIESEIMALSFCP